MDYKEYYKKQISLTEWFRDIGHDKTEALRHEDNEKRERLKVLNEVIQLTYDAPYQFSAVDIASNTQVFQDFLAAHGSELCALRLIPLRIDLPKHRMRGHTIAEAVQWFKELDIDPKHYRADFVPHSDRSRWSAIFVVNHSGIYGEVIRGGLNQLTDGWYENGQPVVFHCDFQTWYFSSPCSFSEELKKAVEMLRVENAKLQGVLSDRLEAEFVQNYLKGYFEVLETEDRGLWFIDYNRILGEMYEDFAMPPEKPTVTETQVLTGQVAFKGKVQGKVRIVQESDIPNTIFAEDEILVCTMTTPGYVPLIRTAKAVVTNLGGILSHAAIICRELGKPCVVGTQHATHKLKDGDLIEVDAERGIIILL